MSKPPWRTDRAPSARTRRPLRLHAEQLEVRAMLAGDTLPQADLLEAEAAPVITVDTAQLVYAANSKASNSGTFTNAVTLSASIGTVVDNGDGTWFWTLGDVQVSDTQTVDITAEDDIGGIATVTFELTIKSTEFQLLQDTEPGNPFNYISQFVQAGDEVYFTTYPSEYPVTLWKTDGTSEGTMILESTTAVFHNLIEFKGELYYLREVGSNSSYDLWKTDGTAEGTAAVFDFSTSNLAVSDVEMAIVGDFLYFNVDDGIHGQELWVSDGTTEGTHLVADIIPGSTGTAISKLTASENFLFFRADDGVQGNELWRTDGTAQGTVRVSDIFTVDDFYKPDNLTAIGDVLYFTAQQGAIWKSDGITGETTPLYHSTAEGDVPAYSGQLRHIDGQLYYVSGKQVWTTDGTTVGTMAIADIPAENGTNLYVADRLNGEIYLIEDSYYSAGVDKLWKVDETTGETTLLATFRGGTFDGSLPFEIEGAFYFRGYDPTYGFQTWRTDGTAEGTTRVTIFRPLSSGAPRPYQGPNGTLLMGIETEQFGREPYVIQIDTPPVITLQLIQLSEDGQNVLLSALGTYDFLDPLSELQFDWDLDGDGHYDDASGPQASISLSDLATLGVANISLRVIDTDGQIATRSLVLASNDPIITVDISEGVIQDEGKIAANSGKFAHALGNELQLSASVGEVVDNGDGTWSWSYETLDGPDDTQTVTITASNGTNQSSVSFELVVFNDSPDFTIDETSVTITQGEIAVNGGTYHDVPADVVTLSASLGEIIDNGDGTGNWSCDASQAVSSSQKVHISFTDELGASRGFSFTLIVASDPPTIFADSSTVSLVVGSIATNSGTFSNPSEASFSLSASIGNVVINPWGTWHWYWDSEGTSEPQTVEITVKYGDGSISIEKFDLTFVRSPIPELIKDLRPGGFYLGSNPDNFIRLGDYIFFFAKNETFEDDLWRTDGTEAGTLFIKPTGRLYSNNINYDPLLNVNGILYFASYDQSVGTLWISDGTAEGTNPIAEFDSPIDYLTEVNGEVYFSADDGIHGVELYKSDGTPQGTEMVADINLHGGSRIHNPIASNGVLIFSADDGIHGKQIWKSDGSSAGTVQLSELELGAAIGDLINVDGTVYFQTFDSSHGYELWKSDGTAEGTELVADIVPGEESSNLRALRSIDGMLYFQAVTPENGAQLWKFDTASGQSIRLTDFLSTSGERIYPPVSFQGDLYFVRDFYDELTDSFNRPAELWKFSEESGVATFVARVAPGGFVIDLNVLYELDGKLYFRGYDDVFGYQLWMTDGTPVGTVPITNLANFGVGRKFIHFADKFIFAADNDSRGTEPFALRLTPGPVAKITDPRSSLDGLDILLSAYGSFDFKDPIADLQFAWDLDGDGLYDDAVGMNPSVSIAELGSSPSWRIGLLVTNSRGISATATQVVDTQSPYLAVDQIQVQVNLSESVTNSGEFGSLLGKSVTLSASIGNVVDNGDGTWSWSYTAPSSGPSQDYTVVITADDGLDQNQVSFSLNERNPPPVIEIEGDVQLDGNRYVQRYVLLGETVTATGTYSDESAGIVSLSASVGELIDHGDGTWSWSYVVPEDSSTILLVELTAFDSDGAKGYGGIWLRTTPNAAAHITINNSDAETDPFGEAKTLPTSLETITEWDSFTVNVWIRRDEIWNDQLTNVSMNLQYDNARFQLKSSAPGGGVGQIEVNNTGDTLEIRASQFDHGDTTLGELLLLGSFRFQPGPNSAIANDMEGGYPESFDLQFMLTDVQTTTSLYGEIPGQQVGAPSTQLQVVPFDLNDDGAITLLDLPYLIRKLGNKVAANPTDYKYDFDRNGTVTLLDLTYLIRNLGNNANNGSTVKFPKYYQPPAPLLESESLLVETTSSLLEAEEITPGRQFSPLNDEEANIDAAFGNLDSVLDCWEPSTDHEQRDFAQAISFDPSPWSPYNAPDWSLHESVIVDDVVDNAVAVLEELEEEFPQLDRFIELLKSRLEDR